MKRFLQKIREKILSKDLPPPYSVNDEGLQNENHEQQNEVPSTPTPVHEVIDLLANCNITNTSSNFSEAEYAEIGDMGLWHSTPLPHRHKSKISLTWVLKENIDKKIHSEKSLYTEEKDRKSRERLKNDWTNRRFKSACDEFNGLYSCSDSSDETEYIRKKHRHRHRRKKKHPKFGYDIKDLDSFLSEATLDRPGNIPVVIAFPTTLYQTQKNLQRELSLPLGTVVNAVFKNQQWLYAQTPHGDEGYVLYTACLPLVDIVGILPSRNSLQKKTPCWESSTDLYPQPCGNLTDTEKEQIRGRTRSECNYKRRRYRSSCAEKDFDTLYLKTKSVSDIRIDNDFTRQTLLLVNSDYVGCVMNKTLTVYKGDVVTLVPGLGESDVDSEWFYVRKSDGSEGFIPAALTENGFI
ncbi:uncharacterized protein LOC125054622 isoform X1 [Pieris napi]|uniref:uncharacterized protein LOC125054622 isoform X1 n=2 Tax=Pieris napi TaxID=78633 RepID=UPI001FBB9809|nr:uncharacterized protein LOC125054622 isoform X1 [Pieris napi]